MTLVTPLPPSPVAPTTFWVNDNYIPSDRAVRYRKEHRRAPFPLPRRLSLLHWRRRHGAVTREKRASGDPTASLYGPPLCRDAPRDRRLPPLGSSLVGGEPKQVARLGTPGATDPRPLPRSAAHGTRPHGGGLRILHRPPGRALRHFRRHPSARRPRGLATDERRVPGHRRRPGIVHRHHRGLHAAHPAASADQPGAPPREAHRHLFHLPRLEHRRHAHPARGSAPVPRVPGGRALHVDVPALGPLRLHGGRPAADLLRVGLHAVRPRADQRATPGPGSGRAPSDLLTA